MILKRKSAIMKVADIGQRSIVSPFLLKLNQSNQSGLSNQKKTIWRITQAQGETLRPWIHAPMGQQLLGNILYSGKHAKRTTYTHNNEGTQA